jgi:hypothetical protein
MRETLVLMVIAACGTVPPIEFDTYPDELLAAECAFRVACDLFPDTATCEDALYFDEGTITTLDNLIAAGAVRYDTDAASACVGTIRAQSCSFPGFQPIDNPCERVFAGTIAPGGACEVDAECEDLGFCQMTDPSCDRSDACCVGTCVARPDEPEIGEACDNTCVAGAYCSPSGTCQAIVTAEGADCDAVDACANPMYCNVASALGTCVVPAASGAECDPEDPLPCADTRDYCDAVRTTCVRESGIGSACSADIDCIGYASCVRAACTADPGLGDACNEGGPACLGSTQCDGITCVAPTASSPECGR